MNYSILQLSYLSYHSMCHFLNVIFISMRLHCVAWLIINRCNCEMLMSSWHLDRFCTIRSPPEPKALMGSWYYYTKNVHTTLAPIAGLFKPDGEIFSRAQEYHLTVITRNGETNFVWNSSLNVRCHQNVPRNPESFPCGLLAIPIYLDPWHCMHMCCN